MGEDVGCVVLVVRHDQQGDAARDQDEDVEDDIALGDFFHPVGRHGVDQTTEKSQSGHYTDGGTGRRLIREVRAHGDSGQKQLGRSILRRGDTGDLAKEVQPTVDPADGRSPFLGAET